MSALAFLSDWPLLALLPAACFLVLAYVCRRPVIWGAACMWIAFAGYGLLVQQGLLCPSDCDNRTDLLFIYPFLGVVSIVAVLSSLRGRRETELP